MLCNNCGKSLEGTSTMCAECASQASRPSRAEPGGFGGANPGGFSAQHAATQARATEDMSLDLPGSPRRGRRFHRFVAFAIDGLILSVPSTLLATLLSGFAASIAELVAPSAGGMTGIMLISILVPILLFFVGVLLLPPIYYILLEGGSHQATLGKRLMGLYVVNHRGERCSYGEAATRYFTKTLLPYAPVVAVVLLLILLSLVSGDQGNSGGGFGLVLLMLVAALFSLVLSWKIFISYLYSPTRQGLHDKFANCFVVTRENHPSTGSVALYLIGAVVGLMIVQAILPQKSEHSFKNRMGKFEQHFPAQQSDGLQQESEPETESEEGYALPHSEDSTPESIDASPAEQQVTTETLPSSSSGMTARIAPIPQLNLVAFGSAQRTLDTAAAFLNPSRTVLRIYLGQGVFAYDQIARFAVHEPFGDVPASGADMLIVAKFSAPVGDDCSLSNAKSVTVALLRNGLTGFPLPGRAPELRITPESLSSDTNLRCGDSTNGKLQLTGTIGGKGLYAQGQAVWPLSWNLAFR